MEDKLKFEAKSLSVEQTTLEDKPAPDIATGAIITLAKAS